MSVFCPNTQKRERYDIRYTIGRDAFFVPRDDDDAKRRPRGGPSSIIVDIFDVFLGMLDDDAPPPRRARRPAFTTTANRESASDGHRGRMFGLSIGRGEL
tara:strand:+ start:138 stop:437 length:300 start_codon:yes stop_codon:yes gene_type:complete